MESDPAVAPALPAPGALLPALAALLIPLAAFALAWFIAGKIPLAVPSREWGTWFFIGPLMSLSGIAGLVFAFKAFVRGSRIAAVAGFILNSVLVLIAWAGLFA